MTAADRTEADLLAMVPVTITRAELAAARGEVAPPPPLIGVSHEAYANDSQRDARRCTPRR